MPLCQAIIAQSITEVELLRYTGTYVVITAMTPIPVVMDTHTKVAVVVIIVIPVEKMLVEDELNIISIVSVVHNRLSAKPNVALEYGGYSIVSLVFVGGGQGVLDVAVIRPQTLARKEM